MWRASMKSYFGVYSVKLIRKKTAQTWKVLTNSLVRGYATNNFSGLERICGEWILTKIKSCKFHFKDSANKHRKNFEEEQKLTFKALVIEVLIALTEEGY